MTNAILYTIAFAVIQIFTQLGFMFAVRQTGGGTVLSTGMQITSMVVASVLTIAVFCLARWVRPDKYYMQSRPWMVLLWSVVGALGCLVPSMWVQEQMPELPNYLEQQMADIMMHRGGYFVVCLLAPVAEELVFRGAVLRSLLAWRPQQRWLMIAVSALAFALVHANPAQMPHAFVIGLLLGWMYERTGSIAPGIAFHWANNTAAYLLFRAYPDPSIRLVDILSGQQRAVGAAIIFSLFVLVPAIYQLHLNMRKAGKQARHLQS